MAEPIDPASDLGHLIGSALKSSSALYDTIGKFNSPHQRLTELLEENVRLSKILGTLSKPLSEATDIDLSGLKRPLIQCERVCEGFKTEVLRRSSELNGRKSDRKWWNGVEYIGHNIADFTLLMAGYSSTFFVAFTILQL